jgi:hypothetical protein
MKASVIKERIMAQTAAELEAMIPKAIEYGAHDLKVMGAAMLQMLGPEAYDKVDKSGVDLLTHGQLMAVAFYELGKVARAFGSLLQGEIPKSDTSFDGRIYWIMFDQLIETGEWRVERD